MPNSNIEWINVARHVFPFGDKIKLDDLFGEGDPGSEVDCWLTRYDNASYAPPAPPLPHWTVCPLPIPFPETHATKSSSPSIATLESLVVPGRSVEPSHVGGINAIRQRGKSFWTTAVTCYFHCKHGHLGWLTTRNVMDAWEHETWHQMNRPQQIGPLWIFFYLPSLKQLFYIWNEAQKKFLHVHQIST